MTELFQELSEISTSRIEGDVLLSKNTTFKIGGAADLAVFPKTANALRDAVTLAKNKKSKRFKKSENGE